MTQVESEKQNVFRIIAQARRVGHLVGVQEDLAPTQRRSHKCDGQISQAFGNDCPIASWAAIAEERLQPVPWGVLSVDGGMCPAQCALWTMKGVSDLTRAGSACHHDIGRRFCNHGLQRKPFIQVWRNDCCFGDQAARKRLQPRLVKQGRTRGREGDWVQNNGPRVSRQCSDHSLDLFCPPSAPILIAEGVMSSKST